MKVQNYFGVKAGKLSEFDPLSLISIYAKKNGKLPEADKSGPSSRIKSQRASGTTESVPHASHTKKQSKTSRQNMKHSSSEIVEDIYSENFEQNDNQI